MNEYDVIIIGTGPAGVSAALYIRRGGRNCLLIGKDGGALLKAEMIENYYGLAEPLTGKALYETGVRQAKRLGAEIADDEVLGIEYDGSFTVEAKKAKYRAKSVIIAMGAARARPDVKGIEQYEGRGVSYCAVCDAFFYRGKDVAVLGSADYAVHESETLQPLVHSVTIITDGEPFTGTLPAGVELAEKKATALYGDGLLEGVELSDGERIAVSGLFIAIGTATGQDLARKVGVITDGRYIKVDENMHTNVPGLFAAGDCTGGLLQVAKAVYQGAVAGLEAVKYLRGK